MSNGLHPESRGDQATTERDPAADAAEVKPTASEFQRRWDTQLGVKDTPSETFALVYGK